MYNKGHSDAQHCVWYMLRALTFASVTIRSAISIGYLKIHVAMQGRNPENVKAAQCAVAIAVLQACKFT
jgi:hypothetical protein